MSDRSQKISELPVATSVGPSDLLYLVQANTSKAVPASTLGLPSALTFTVGPTEGNTTLASNGTTDVLWFTANSAQYPSMELTVIAQDTVNTDCKSFSKMYFTVANNVLGMQTIFNLRLGSNHISANDTANLNGNSIQLYFNRAAASTANVIFRYQVTYWNF